MRGKALPTPQLKGHRATALLVLGDNQARQPLTFICIRVGLKHQNHCVIKIMKPDMIFVTSITSSACVKSSAFG